MGRGAQAGIAFVLLGCGARTDLGAPKATDASAPCVLAAFPVCDAGPAPFDACAPLHFKSGLAATCALRRSSCMPLDVAGFEPPTCPQAGTDPCVTPDVDSLAVFAANRYGKGHIAALCDVTGLNDLFQELRLAEYLGQSTNARIATLGTYPCNAGIMPGTYFGASLPPVYVGAPAALANEFDVVVLCAAPKDFMDHTEYGPLDIAWAPTFVSFVRDFGKGVLVGADYARNCASPPDVFAPLDAITEGAGITFAVANFGGAALTIDSECVPDWPK